MSLERIGSKYDEEWPNDPSKGSRELLTEKRSSLSKKNREGDGYTECGRRGREEGSDSNGASRGMALAGRVIKAAPERRGFVPKVERVYVPE